MVKTFHPIHKDDPEHPRWPMQTGQDNTTVQQNQPNAKISKEKDTSKKCTDYGENTT